MNRNSAPLFVEERKYRRRRLGDAARILPLGGAVLLILPLLWTRVDGSATAREALYLFLVWATLILCAALLSRALSATSRSLGTPPTGGLQGGGGQADARAGAVPSRSASTGDPEASSEKTERAADPSRDDGATA